jgi:hypothetical protein
MHFQSEVYLPTYSIVTRPGFTGGGTQLAVGTVDEAPKTPRSALAVLVNLFAPMTTNLIHPRPRHQLPFFVSKKDTLDGNSHSQMSGKNSGATTVVSIAL